MTQSFAPKRGKRHISIIFTLPDGTTGTRSSMEDFQTLPSRVLENVWKIAGEDLAKQFLVPGINAYNLGEYKEALDHFEKAINCCPGLVLELKTHMDFCRNVLSIPLNAEDKEYESEMSRWHNKPKTVRWLLRAYAPTFKIRCKYCGHYTVYEDPNYGLAYLGENCCQNCGRGYPAPDFVWDSVDGKAYIYYRNSVRDEEFYKDFEREYDVHFDRTFFLRKKEPVDDFLADCCTISPTAKVMDKDLWEAYKTWCEQNNQCPLSRRNFRARLAEQGCELSRSTDNRWVWSGIGLVS